MIFAVPVDAIGRLAPAWAVLMLSLVHAVPASADGGDREGDEEPFVEAAARVRPGVAAIGTYHRHDAPTARYFGSGFVVSDGWSVVTNLHVVEAVRESGRFEQLRVFFPDDRAVEGRTAVVVAEDRFRDLALLRLERRPGAPLRLADDALAPQGRSVGMMGYPVGMRLGLVPAVHRGVVAATVPAVLPLPKGAKLTPELAALLRNPYKLYQLDMVALPGNSGSPLFDARSGRVIGIVNKVLGNRTREHLIEKPSGIAYAVPVRWVRNMIDRAEASGRTPRP